MSSVLRAAGLSDVGRLRTVNEDRVHVDVARGIFIVVDGVGGQAAGGKAADTAVAMLRERLERQTGALADRVREAITIANNEIHRVASQRPEWRGMACVLTVVVVDGHHAVVGHVGDTRMYRLQDHRIEKVTPDHSPVGEREDAHELSELEAMRHPRRNEVYRDVGSETHGFDDRDFVHVADVEFPDDAALVICSDGLTDLVPAEAIRQAVGSAIGEPDRVVAALVEMANDAGGKDNVSVVYVEGPRFGRSRAAGAAAPAAVDGVTGRQMLVASSRGSTWSRVFDAAILATLIVMLLLQVGTSRRGAALGAIGASAAHEIVVHQGESIMAAIQSAPAGWDVVVEPGEYRERLTLTPHVRVMSRVPRGATLRLPGAATEMDAAVVAENVIGAELVGFRIVGDAATPLGTAVLTHASSVRLVDLEVTGATGWACDFGAGPGVELLGSDVHDNPGGAVILRTGAAARVTHSVFARNGTSDRAVGAVVIERDATGQWSRNVFENMEPSAIERADEIQRSALTRDNWFTPLKPASLPAAGRGGRGR